MTEQLPVTPAPLLVDLADLAARLERIEHALERWKALDAKAQQAGRLSAEDERERADVTTVYTLDGQAVLHELFARVRQARQAQ